MISKKLQEELTAQYNPEGSELRSLQNHLLILLEYFDKICRDNNITYWLSSGTCLGAIRHQGFIPWDDDIDVEMLRDDYLKFIKVFQPDEDFVLQTYNNDLYYTEPFPKLRLRKTFIGEGKLTSLYKNKGVFLDIFIMERSNSITAAFCHLVLGSLRRISYCIMNPTSITDMFFTFVKKGSFGIVDFMRLFKFLSKKELLRHTIGTGLVKNIRKESEIFPLGKAYFEGKEYPVPGNVDLYLHRMFGNYIEIPSSVHTHIVGDIRLLSENDYRRLKHNLPK